MNCVERTQLGRIKPTSTLEHRRRDLNESHRIKHRTRLQDPIRHDPANGSHQFGADQVARDEISTCLLQPFPKGWRL